MERVWIVNYSSSYVPNLSSVKTKTEARARIFKENENSRRETGSRASEKEKKENAKRLDMRRMHRLTGARNFTLLFRSGKKKDFGALRVVARRNLLSHARFAFIAPRAADKRAVARNRLRRRTREWFRRQENLMNAPIDIAVIFTKDAARLSRKNFYESLREASRFIRLV